MGKDSSRFATHSTAESIELLQRMTGGIYTFGQLLETYRKCEEWTQETVARLSGIGVSRLTALENDEQEATREEAACLAELYGMSPGRWISQKYKRTRT